MSNTNYHNIGPSCGTCEKWDMSELELIEGRCGYCFHLSPLVVHLPDGKKEYLNSGAVCTLTTFSCIEWTYRKVTE